VTGRIEHALNYRFYLDRLDDPGLLARAVVAEDGDLAVPADGKRRGGYLQAGSRAAGRRLVRRLSERPAEFPDARCVRGDGWLVEWGPELDWRASGEHDEDYAAAGRYFGYSEAAIAAYRDRS
jgi:uncharacterized protein DUF6302